MHAVFLCVCVCLDYACCVPVCVCAWTMRAVFLCVCVCAWTMRAVFLCVCVPGLCMLCSCACVCLDYACCADHRAPYVLQERMQMHDAPRIQMATQVHTDTKLPHDVDVPLSTGCCVGACPQAAALVHVHRLLRWCMSTGCCVGACPQAAALVAW